MILTVAFLLFGSILVWALYNGIGPVPTSPKVEYALFSALPSKIEGTIIEAGCGWGHIAIRLAKKYPKNRVVGIENSPLPFLVSKLMALLSRKQNLEIQYGSIWNYPFKEAGLIYSFLYSGAMAKMAKKCERELQEGCYLITSTFRLPGWEPLAVQHAEDLYQTAIYTYRRG